MRKIVFISFFLIVTISAFGQSVDQKRKAYIERWKDEAIHQMHIYKIPASITLAQGILETGGGQSWLAETANNHFGIKCHDWTGDSVHYDDDAVGECFRKYKQAEDSYRDHSIFLTTRRWYKDLFTLDIYDYKAWCYGLKKAGYATNPKYPQILISLIDKYKLYLYDYKDDPAHLIARDAKPLVAEEPVEAVKKSKPKKEKEPKKKRGFSTEISISKYHPVQLHENNLKYVIARNGDTYYGLAQELGLSTWQLYKYNDISKDHKLSHKEVVFIQAKKKKAKNATYHVVQPGETIHQISQQHGVRLKNILKYNRLSKQSSLTVGDKVYLEKDKF